MDNFYNIDEQLLSLKRKKFIRNRFDKKSMETFLNEHNYFYFMDYNFLRFFVNGNENFWVFKKKFSVKNFKKYFEKLEFISGNSLFELKSIEQFLKTQFLIFIGERYDVIEFFNNSMKTNQILLSNQLLKEMNEILKTNDKKGINKIINKISFGNFEAFLKTLSTDESLKFIKRLGFSKIQHFNFMILVFNISRNLCAHDNLIFEKFRINPSQIRNIRQLIKNHLTNDEIIEKHFPIKYHEKIKNFPFLYTEKDGETYFFSIIILCWLLIFEFYDVTFKKIQGPGYKQGRNEILSIIIFILKWY